ncbi:hypothetical protein FBU59_002132 [Linderina macrospora]|uniref:Uncharacterized protein n=1 Tax=Linderina macrospora TaxID=4868 RepID=A0ACC1JCA5_9FUNG|nr:hypothetical protein FBU59_002132 [Linderina macrospora]
MDAIPNYQLRVKNPGLCDTSVTQYSGYLDTAEDRHFYFWFFEARKVKREDAPIILWLNGGPGCSSFTGLLMELGPCRVTKGGNSTDYNPFGWNDRAHIIFLDQPTNVGFSYGKDVFSSIAAGKDINALLQLFYKSFPEYANSELHVFGESYGGHYVPAVAKAIHEANTELEQKRSLSLLTVSEEEQRRLPLASIGIGNGIVNPLVQFKSFSTMACNSTYPPVLDQKTCDKMDADYPTCARLLKECYKWGTTDKCTAATNFCYPTIKGPYMDTGRNPYDVRRYCIGNGLCYEIEDDIDTYLNNPAIQRALGAEVAHFESCSDKVGTGFSLSGDHSKPFHLYIPPLLADNIRVLIYAGDADFTCNWYGNKAWSLDLEWLGKAEFNAASDRAWLVEGKDAGEVRTHGNFTFLRVFGAGHMVPYDKPKESLDMVNRWLAGTGRVVFSQQKGTVKAEL